MVPIGGKRIYQLVVFIIHTLCIRVEGTGEELGTFHEVFSRKASVLCAQGKFSVDSSRDVALSCYCLLQPSHRYDKTSGYALELETSNSVGLLPHPK